MLSIINLRSAVVVSSSLGLFLLGAQFVASQLPEADWNCDTGPDALMVYGKNIPQTCIDVPFDGGVIERCFYTYVPESCSTQEEIITKAPLVLDVHGMGSCALWSSSYTGWMQKAEEECIVVLWPSGSPNTFVGSCFDTPGFLLSSEITGVDSDNEVSTAPCCCLSMDMLPATETIDPIFLKMAIDTTVEALSLSTTNDESSLSIDNNIHIDIDRIYMAGHSNGCMMSLAMAALYSDTIAAVCCHAGALVTPFPETYSPVPIWMIHGTEDQTIPYDGSTLLTLPGVGALGFLSMDQTMSYLENKNECSDSEEMDLEDEKTGVVVGTVRKKTNCKNGATVEIVALSGVGHNPYKDGVLSETDVDTTALAWEFCSSYSKAGTGPPKADDDEDEDENEEEPEVEKEPQVEPERDANESSSASTPPTAKSFSILLVGLFVVFGIMIGDL